MWLISNSSFLMAFNLLALILHMLQEGQVYKHGPYGGVNSQSIMKRLTIISQHFHIRVSYEVLGSLEISQYQGR